MIRVGDKVKANPDYPYKWESEDMKLDQIYIVSEVKSSGMFGDYVQLEGIQSSYPEKAVIVVEAKK